MTRALTTTAVLCASLALAPAAAQAAAPARLSQDDTPADIRSSEGSGNFGSWITDEFQLPAYRYDLDHRTAPQAVQAEIAGKREALHLLGNDHINAFAFNRGYVQLWSQDRRYQWANLAEPDAGHYAGGYGFLRTQGKTYSTLYDDQPTGTGSKRVFGAGYFQRANDLGGVHVDEHVYAPYGDDPLLLHDVVLTNKTASPQSATWFEYWDVNPYDQNRGIHIGFTAPTWDPKTRTLAAKQLPNPDGEDTDPLSIFAAAIQGPVDGFETHAPTFFGTGDRGHPDGAAAATATNSIDIGALPGQTGTAAMVFRTPVQIAPGQSVTLRYAYGAAHEQAIAKLVERQRAASNPLEATENAWHDSLPQIALGDRPALSRELQWAAYTVRAATVYEEACGQHVIDQGGLYQYDLGTQAAFRDNLDYTRAMDYLDPALSREILRYSAQEQPADSGQVPYGMRSLCNRDDFGFSTDLDTWLLLGAAEYGLSSHDLGFFDQQVPYALGTGSGTMWEHLKLAFEHQESLHGTHGGYVTGATGDWADGATTQIQLTESSITPAMAAFIYPRMALLAEARGDETFARRLRDAAAKDLAMVRGQWVDRGWFARGFSGERQLGTGAIYGEMQPWAMLAGAPNPQQATKLVGSIKRFLTGIGAPAQVHGPTKIGSAMSPARNDPDVTENSYGAQGVGDNNAVYLGGVWYAENGYLVQALSKLDGVVPGAGEFAFDEMQRNSLLAHAKAFPNHWNGIISADDACNGYFATDPSQCGINLGTHPDAQQGGVVKAFATQNIYSSFDQLLDTIHMSGVVPTPAGFEITPHFPLKEFNVRLARFGLAAKPGEVRGYVSAEVSRELQMDVATPDGVKGGDVVTYAAGKRVPHRIKDGRVLFALPVRKGDLADWAVTSPSGDEQSNSKACSSRRRFKIRLGPRHGRLKHAVVKVSGRRVAVRGGRRLSAVVDLRRTRRSTVTVVITGRVGDHRYRQTRRYRPCSRRGTTKR